MYEDTRSYDIHCMTPLKPSIRLLFPITDKIRYWVTVRWTLVSSSTLSEYTYTYTGSRMLNLHIVLIKNIVVNNWNISSHQGINSVYT